MKNVADHSAKFDIVLLNSFRHECFAIEVHKLHSQLLLPESLVRCWAAPNAEVASLASTLALHPPS